MSTGCFLKAVPFPSACTVEFILSGTHRAGEVLDYSVFHVLNSTSVDLSSYR